MIRFVEQNDQAGAVAVIKEFLAELDATADEEEQLAILGDGVDVRVNGLPWLLSLEPDGWYACPGHDNPELVGAIEVDDTDGEPRRIGGPDLTAEAIVGLLLVADRSG
jgi:hypothetical protein